MTNDTKWEELRQAEEMAYFKADICLYSPELVRCAIDHCVTQATRACTISAKT